MTSRAPLSAHDGLDEIVDYLVDAPEGPVGVLDGWTRDPDGRPTGLIVSQGWFGRRRLTIPVEKLAQVDREHRRIVVASAAAPREREHPFRRRLERHTPPDGQAALPPTPEAAPREEAAARRRLPITSWFRRR